MKKHLTKLALPALIVGLIYLHNQSFIDTYSHFNAQWEESISTEKIDDGYQGFAAFTKSFISTRDTEEPEKPTNDQLYYQRYELLLAAYE